MASKGKSRLNLSILWGCGYAIVISQWLSNGSFGSSWLPAFSELGLFSAIGPAVLWAFYTMSLILLGVRLERIISPIFRKKWLLAFSALLMIAGDFIVFSVGGGFFQPWLYIVGMGLIGCGVSVLALGWGEYYCAVGEKTTCVNLSLSFILGSGLFFLVTYIAQHDFVAAMLFQLALIPISATMLIKAWRLLEVNPIKERDTSGFGPFVISLRQLIPYFVTVFVFGFFLGVITGLSVTQNVVGSSFIWAVGAAGMVTMGALLVLGALSLHDFNLDRLSRVLIPLLVIFALLVPVLFHNYSDIVFILLCSGYVYARVFYTVAYVSIAQTKAVPALPLIAVAISADAFGVIIGEVFCSLTLRGSLSAETIYVITSVAIGLIIITGSFFLREKNITSLWGLKKLDYSDEVIEKKCLRIALDYNLTLQETKIIAYLAKGLTAEMIAQEFGITLATVRTHTRNIYSKMDIHSQPELIRTIVFTDNSKS